jgi:hypothetical protein
VTILVERITLAIHVIDTYHLERCVPSSVGSARFLTIDDEKELTMAQKVQVQLIDDIDGAPADETVTFALDGVTYEIDLTDAHAKALRESFAEWVGHARRAGGRRTPARRAGGATRPASSDAGKIRDWARQNGYEVSERGRISAEIREAYERATN